MGIAAVGMILAVQGCGSDSSSGGTGGTSGGGTGGLATGSGGSDGGTAACTAVTSPQITGFEPDAGTGLSIGAPFTFADTAGGVAVPTVTTTGGNLHATFNTGVPTSQYPYAGWGLPFNSCFDVSAFTGVKFNISGTLTGAGCSIQFSLGDRQHSNSPPFGTCVGSCYPGAKIFTLPAAAADVTVLFSEIGAGSPAAPIVVPAEGTGIQWQLNVSTAAGCTGDVTIDNVVFVQ